MTRLIDIVDDLRVLVEARNAEIELLKQEELSEATDLEKAIQYQVVGYSLSAPTKGDGIIYNTDIKDGTAPDGDSALYLIVE